MSISSIDNRIHESIQYNHINPYYFRGLAALVHKTLSSSVHAEAWFSSNTIRAKIFNFLKYPKDTSEQTASLAWKACVYTAPLALTIIAPKKSYEAIELDLVGLSLNYQFDRNRISIYQYAKTLGELGKSIDVNELPASSKRIELGLNCLKKHLSEKMEENQGKVFLCYIYGTRQVFLIERRGSDKFYLFQSYLDQYGFLQFLEEDSKHKSWTQENLMNSLETILQECPFDNWKQKIAIYQALFHYKKESPLKIQSDEHDQIVPFTFIATDTYLLDWRLREQSLGIYTENPGNYSLKNEKKEVANLSAMKEMLLLAKTIQDFFISKNFDWFYECKCIEGPEIVRLYKSILDSFENEEMKKSFSLFLKTIFHHSLGHSLVIRSFSQMHDKDICFLLEMLPWSNIPLGLFEGIRFNNILWSVISSRAAKKELVDNSIGLKKANSIAHYIDNSYLIGSYMAEASPELISARIPFPKNKITIN